MSMPSELQALEDQLCAAQRDAQSLVAGLTEQTGTWHENPSSWSVADCLDHLATANRVYLQAMQPAAVRAQEQGKRRRGPAQPGILGRLFVNSLEPPAKRLSKLKAPAKIRPRAGVSLAQAVADFLASQDEVLAFLRANAGLDLAGVRFLNPFIRGIGFSLATGLHVIAAHERRHLWQAWRVRRAAEGAAPTDTRESASSNSS